jgi:hypothetical protein
VAIRAARTTRALAEHLRFSLEPHERIEAAPYLRRLPGGRIRPPVSQYDTGWWRRIQITEDRRGFLRFEVLTERARTEEREQLVQRALIDSFVEAAETTTSYNSEVSSTLFELLLPNDLKDQAHEQTDLVLQLDDTTAQYPWELLTERLRGQAEPFATTVGLIRQLRTREGEFRAVVGVPRERFALVVGDTQSGWEALPGAQEEARAVHTVLQAAGYASRPPLIRASGAEIVRELFSREYQILHIAAHGDYQAGRPLQSGVVLGPGLFLTSAEIGMIRAVPPFVFLNCCHLGKVDETQASGAGRRPPHFSKLAASLATQLIRMGVRAVVAAGWAVDDRLASVFAQELYQGLLSGQTFGRAVLNARQATYQAGPDRNTWGAYQCYGDPEFVLDLRSARGAAAPDPHGFVAPRELLDEVASLRADAGQADLAGWAVLSRRLDELEQAAPADWRDGELLAALAAARRDVGSWKDAIEGYRKALDSWGAEVPMQAVEALANLEIRSAIHLRKNSDPSYTSEGLIAEAVRRLDWLMKLGRTPERLALLGSAYKRIALAAATDEERSRALQKAAESYRKADESYRAARGAINPYYALNWVACRYVTSAGQDPELLSRLTDCEQEAARLAIADPTFHHRLHALDLALHRHLIRGDLADQEEDLVARYRKVVASGSASAEAASVAEHLEFLITFAESLSPGSGPVLRRIANGLGNRAAAGL